LLIELDGADLRELAQTRDQRAQMLLVLRRRVSLHVVESELTSEPRSRAFDGLD